MLNGCINTVSKHENGTLAHKYHKWQAALRIFAIQTCYSETTRMFVDISTSDATPGSLCWAGTTWWGETVAAAELSAGVTLCVLCPGSNGCRMGRGGGGEMKNTPTRFNYTAPDWLGENNKETSFLALEICRVDCIELVLAAAPLAVDPRLVEL